MNVPHLNEFLSRAIRHQILEGVLVDFSKARVTYCNRSVVSVAVSTPGRVVFKDSKGSSWNWGIGGMSLEIVRIRKARVGGGEKFVVVLGRTCNSKGVVRE